MMNNIRFLLNASLALPLVPVIIWQAKNVRRRIPELPEATGPQGMVDMGVQRSYKIIILGESTAAGVGVKTHQEGFSGALAERLAEKTKTNISWSVFAKSGYTAKRVDLEIVPQIQEKDCDLIVVGLGGNDTFKLNNPWVWQRNIRHLIYSLKRKFDNTPIVFTNMPPVKEFPAFTPLMRYFLGNHVLILGKALKEVSETIDLVYYHDEVITLDAWNKRLNIDAKPSDYFSDGVHPSKLTYQAWAQAFSDFVISRSVLS